LLPLSHIKSALNQIYSSNILNFAGGRLGAVNGMRKDGTVGRRHLQADEMWVGVTYALQHHLYSRVIFNVVLILRGVVTMHATIVLVYSTRPLKPFMKTLSTIKLVICDH
ncbi:hypothetical protein WUBG_11725, partial [Wuchereria bancrofti]